MPHEVAESRQIDAPAETVWTLVADLTRMGEWSPENRGGRWAKGDGPAVGSVFRGNNRNGFWRWSTRAAVIDSVPGRCFEIAVTFAGIGIANWRYEFEETAAGCRVTESWLDKRAGWMRVLARPLGDHSATHAHQEMAATLANLAKAAEQVHSGR